MELILPLISLRLPDLPAFCQPVTTLRCIPDEIIPQKRQQVTIFCQYDIGTTIVIIALLSNNISKGKNQSYV